MPNIGGVNATFTALNIKSGKAVMQFELAQTDAKLLPDLAQITGEPVVLDVSTAQQELIYADAETVGNAAAPALPMLEMGA